MAALLLLTNWRETVHPGLCFQNNTVLSIDSHMDLGLAQMEVDIEILKLFGVLKLLTDT